jgi:hypothetical protein
MKYIILTLTLLFTLNANSQIITSIEDSYTINFLTDDIEYNSISVLIVKQQWQELNETNFFYVMSTKWGDDELENENTVFSIEEAEELKKLIDNIWAKRKEKSISIEGNFDGALDGEFLYKKGKLFINVETIGAEELYDNTIILLTTPSISFNFELKQIKKLKKSLESFSSLIWEREN